jgi:DNA-binding transcriptional MocR family regulator
MGWLVHPHAPETPRVRRHLAVEGLGAFAAAESREDPALIVGYGAPAEHAFTAAVARLTAALAE